MNVSAHAHDELAEREATGAPGIPLLALGVAAALGAIALVAHRSDGLAHLLILAALWALLGLTAVAPGEARVVQLFGRHAGTVRAPGLRWLSPFTQRRRVSTRVRNHEPAVAKVNDGEGNPIEIAAVIVWQVADTAGARFGVDDFVRFVGMQTEAAVRHLATSLPYEPRGAGQRSLRTHTAEVAGELSTEIADRVRPAGVRILESRITRLSYAPERARAMLQRQQAEAVVAARQRIVDRTGSSRAVAGSVEGAVGMVDMALARLADEHIVELDEERKATVVSNLLVVLCSDRGTQPVVNTGTLHQ